MHYEIHPAAADEFEEASEHCRQIRASLGQRFEDDFDETLDRLLTHPNAWHPMGRRYRRCSFSDFSFGIIYYIDEPRDCCRIYAVMHFRKKLGYWKNRQF